MSDPRSGVVMGVAGWAAGDRAPPESDVGPAVMFAVPASHVFPTH